MSINVRKLLAEELPDWIRSNLAVSNVGVVANPFWVVPIAKSDPTYDAVCESGIKRLNSTTLSECIQHDSLNFVRFQDEEGEKISISSSNGTLPTWSLTKDNPDFDTSELSFLQAAHFVTKYKLPAAQPVPAAIVNTAPVFEEDLREYFPNSYTWAICRESKNDSTPIIVLKSLLILESDRPYVKDLSRLILDVGYAIPNEEHSWIFEQLLTAVKAQRIKNFYLEIYKLFEFFFPLESIFSLADKLKYDGSELKLLEYCRSSLSWNMNHQRGARSAITYASPDFARACLNEGAPTDADQLRSFKERAIEKLTVARHALTHQDFRAITISEADISPLAEALLIFLRDAFGEYSLKLKTRKQSAMEKSQPVRKTAQK